MLVRRKVKFSIFSIIAALLISFVSSNFQTSTALATSEDSAIQDDYKGLIEFFDLIDSIPQEVIDSGEQEVANWLSEETGLALIAEDGIIKSSSFQTRGFLGCSAAILGVLAGVGIPFTKILKLKKAISALGGMGKLVDDVLPLAREYQKKEGLGKIAALKKATKKKAPELGGQFIDAIADIAGITAVADACFG
ncbi:hypothetical protein P9443_05140 [Peribacillus frigoritolerans]|jgi:hypothetical protein|uniref:hypothetical protein n=1 Tax=Peribacillus frigoritolerans TaxID=450367 RepID=UPI002E22220B|nr:hypothetical protein [Peribacillus frigoritolerans]